MFKIIVNISCFVFIISTINADTIEVKNHTSDPIWAGIYYVKANLVGSSLGPAIRYKNLNLIPGKQSIKIKRPPLLIKTNRELIFSDQKYQLKDKLPTLEYKQTSRTAAGIKHGSTFHIAQKDNVLHGYSDIGWKVVNKVIAAKNKIFNRVAKKARTLYSKHKHGKEQATVRFGRELAEQEVNYLTKRQPKTKLALAKVLGEELDDTDNLRIAVCMSGGGMRAATAAQGLFEGLEDIGLLDALTYAAGLSGSTWMLSSFTELNMPIQEYSTHFVKALSTPHVFNPKDIINTLLKKKIFDQGAGMVDIYGVFLAHTFFHNLTKSSARQNIKLSSSERFLENGDCIFPIYTAIEVIKNSKRWVTFTPYEIGCDDLIFNIPTWSFGRRFAEGKSSDFAPEPSLGFLMGIWGSAGSGSIQNMLQSTKNKTHSSLFKVIDKALTETGVGNTQFAAIKISNPTFGVDTSITRNLKRLTLMDAGYAYNLPMRPLLKKERGIDIIIVMDASANVHDDAPALQRAVADIKNRNIPFPEIEFESITDKQVSLFIDKDNDDAPAVIFLAPVKNDKFSDFDPKKLMRSTYATKNFVYKAKDVQKMIKLIRQNIIDNKALFYKAIREKIEQKR